MKSTVLILHGIEGVAGKHWQGWLSNELMALGYNVIMPTLPDANHPDRNKWLETIKRLCRDIQPNNLSIVGHSLGVLSALDYIETIPTKIYKLISVSGFSDDYHAELNSYFIKEKAIYFKKVNQNINHSYVIYGDNDPYVPQKNLSLLAKNLKTESFIVENGGHLNLDSGFTSFPLLLDLITES